MAMQGSELKAIRNTLGLTQSELGRVLGLSGRYVGMMENDRPGAPIEPRTQLALYYLLDHPDTARTLADSTA